MSKEDVVNRLKALQEQEGEEEYADGHRAGREWAHRRATPAELRRLARYIEDQDPRVDWWDVDYPWQTAPFGATDHFVFAVRPKRKDDRSAPQEFWEEVLGEDAHRLTNADFFHGFGDGAVEAWDEVKDEL